MARDGSSDATAYRAPWPRARTKLVCTLGPASEGRLDELLEAGAAVLRLNLAHGDPAALADRVRAIREASARTGREVAVLADLPGPKVRLGALAGGSIELEAGETVMLVPLGTAAARGGGRSLETSHPGLAHDLRPDDHVHLADGAVELVVQAIDGAGVRALVERGGTVRSRAGVSVPAARLSLPVIGERDRELAVHATAAGVDLLGQSFVRGPADIEALRAIVGPGGPGIVAKIETRPALEAIDAILAVADGVMIARGDLGLDLPFEAVPVVQKRLVAAAVARHRPVIVATQMLESMHEAPRPTRAEASDVANAVLDGADAVMLSGETAIGRYPLLSVDAAIRICRAAEDADLAGAAAPVAAPRHAGIDASLVLAAVPLASAADVVVTVAPVPHVLALAAHRPATTIVAVVPDVQVARSLLAARGVVPVVPDDARHGPGGDAGSDAILDDAAVRAALGDARRVVLLVMGDDHDGRLEVVHLDARPAAGRGGGAGAA